MDITSFVALAAVLALAAHSVERDFGNALLATVIAAVVALQVVFFIQRGYLDKFALVEMMTSSGIATLVAAAVGAPFVYYRWWTEKNAARKGQRNHSSSQNGPMQ